MELSQYEKTHVVIDQFYTASISLKFLFKVIDGNHTWNVALVLNSDFHAFF